MQILIWTLEDRRSHWATTLKQAAASIAAACGSRQNCYMGVGLAPTTHSRSNARCKADDVMAIGGLWADIDLAETGGKRHRPTAPRAREVIASLERQPTMVVGSGHGLHLWWLFRELWTFDDPAERALCVRRSFDWSQYLKARFAPDGIDSVGDLARVMRIPGTMNYKPPEAAVTLVSMNEGLRYNPNDFDEFQDVSSRISVSTSLLLSSSTAPPFEKFQALSSNVDRFSSTWERRRRDMTDTSASGYDMALAVYATKAGWTDDEIAALLIASRRKHGDDLKLDARHQDYYSRTIGKARGYCVEETKFDNAAANLVSGADSGRAPAEVVSDLGTLLGIPITGIKKYLSTPAEYRIVTDQGEITIGGIADLLSAHIVRLRLAEITKRLAPRLSQKAWDRIAQVMLEVAEDVNVGDEATDAGATSSMLEAYLEAHRIVDGADAEIAFQSGVPVRHNGAVCINGSKFREWLRFARGENMTMRKLSILLKQHGGEPQQVRIKGTVRRVWRLPDA